MVLLALAAPATQSWAAGLGAGLGAGGVAALLGAWLHNNPLDDFLCPVKEAAAAEGALDVGRDVEAALITTTVGERRGAADTRPSATFSSPDQQSLLPKAAAEEASEAPQPFVQPPALVVPMNPEVNPHWQNQLLGTPVMQTAPMYYYPAGASVFPTDPNVNPLYWLQLQMVPVPESAPEPAPVPASAEAASSTDPEPAPAPTRPARKGTRLVNKAIGKKPPADA
eukprot:s4524_g3.t1